MTSAPLTWAQRLLMGLVRGYRLLLSPWLDNACLFEPTCSNYSIQAIQKHGAAVGTYMTLHRLARCQPFCAGGHDPVPEHPPRLFRPLVTAAQRAGATLTSSSIDKTHP